MKIKINKIVRNYNFYNLLLPKVYNEKNKINSHIVSLTTATFVSIFISSYFQFYLLFTFLKIRTSTQILTYLLIYILIYLINKKYSKDYWEDIIIKYIKNHELRIIKITLLWILYNFIIPFLLSSILLILFKFIYELIY